MNNHEGRDRKAKEIDRAAPDEPDSAAEPGSATGMFQQPPSATPAESRREACSAANDENSRSAEGSPSSADPSGSAVEQKAASGEFTQFFRRMAPAAADALPQAKPSAVRPGAGDDAPGDFTRIFMRLPQAPEAAPAAAAPAPLKAQETPPEAEPGEFTRLMRAAEIVDGAPNHRDETAPDAADGRIPSSAPLRGFSAPGVNDAVSGKSAAGFTQLFRALDERLPEGRDAPPYASPMDVQAPEPSPVQQQAGAALQAGPGEFTRLMQSLSNPSAGESAAEGASKTPGPGATSAGVRPVSTASSSPASSPPRQSSTGPGDFTRIVSSSLAREEAAATGKATPARAERTPVPPPAPPAQAAPIPRSPSFAFGGQAAPPAGGATPIPAPPQAPPPAAPAQGKLHAYLPMLLVINAFLLAVLILLVVFALRHH